MLSNYIVESMYEIKKIHLILIIIFCTLNTSCQETIKLPDRLTNSLLYTESKDKEGIGAGGFSEILAFDLTNNTTYHLTNDRYSDRYPSYSSLINTVAFESKRSSDPDIVGLTADSKIFTLNLTDKSLRSLDLYKGPGKNGLDEQSIPVFSNDGNKICYKQYIGNIPRHYHLFIYDFSNDLVYLLQADLRMPIKYIWSEDNSKIYLSCYSNNSIKNPEKSISFIDLKTKFYKEIIKKDSTENIVGDIKQNKMIYISCKTSYASDYYIIIYDLVTHKETFSLNMNKLGFKEIKTPVFADNEEIYFIGNPIQFEGATGDDIYKMNLQTKKIDRVTFSELMKNDLSFIK